jgi:hypothetical protein
MLDHVHSLAVHLVLFPRPSGLFTNCGSMHTEAITEMKNK